MKVYESQYDFERWYNQVKELSIESQVIQITKEQAEGMIYRGTINDKVLYETIEKAISELGGSVFAKFRRSPKDYATQSLSDENPMKIQAVRQLLTLVSHSERLVEDLNYPNPLILRKWERDIGIEFRCFICNQQLNAVSLQPNQSEQIDKDRGVISEYFNSQEIIEIFKEKIGKVLYPHCVVDVGLMMSGDGIKMKIIEINPFGKMAQSGYFSWVIDRDILFEGFAKTGKVCLRFQRE
ncbi:hypothetical protein FGO68_gene9732 [Halteria grandinella]|uniref:Cell division cycle protein 123 n=1 Tax=Halteria grandinella TaxID=5974 RepID=A0A8J8NLR8_HALGN|nr:hypothetical protein FGO68_gene9732 [Halteria grandinella]